MKKYLSFGLIVMVCWMAGCKKEEQKCPSLWSAIVEQTEVKVSCENEGLLDSSILYFGFRPQQAAFYIYQVYLRFKNEVGTQYMFGGDTSVGVWVYDTRNLPVKIYSLRGPDAYASITVTATDSNAKIVMGQFNATLVEDSSLSDSIRVRDGRFFINYELW